MSYILDALKKSEEERSRKQTPRLRDILIEKQDSALPGLKSILTIVTLTAFISSASVYLFFDRNKALENTTVKLKENQSINNTQIADTLEPQIDEDKLLEQIKNQRNSQSQVSDKPIAPPVLNITTHIFAKEADLRMVMINGMTRREGDSLGENHRLIEITERGLVLIFHDKQYKLNVVEDWQIN